MPEHSLPDTEAIGERIAEIAAHMDAASHELLREIRRFDEAAGWCAAGAMARRSTAAQLERLCRVYRRVRPEDASPDDHRRFVAHRSTDDGMVRVEIQLPPDQADLLMRAFRAAARGGALS